MCPTLCGSHTATWNNSYSRSATECTHGHLSIWYIARKCVRNLIALCMWQKRWRWKENSGHVVQASRRYFRKFRKNKQKKKTLDMLTFPDKITSSTVTVLQDVVPLFLLPSWWWRNNLFTRILDNCVCLLLLRWSEEWVRLHLPLCLWLRFDCRRVWVNVCVHPCLERLLQTTSGKPACLTSPLNQIWIQLLRVTVEWRCHLKCVKYIYKKYIKKRHQSRTV